ALIALPALYRARAALRANIGTIITGAIGVFIYPLAFYSSMHLAGVAIGTVVSLGSAPIASGLLERIIEKQKLSRWWMLAATLGITGSTLLCLAKMYNAPSETWPTIFGIGLGLIAGFTTRFIPSAHITSLAEQTAAPSDAPPAWALSSGSVGLPLCLCF